MYKILLIDDNDKVYNELIKIHNSLIDKVYFASKVQDIQDFIQQKNIDIVVSEIKIGDTDLFPILEQIKTFANRVPVIIFTSDSDRENVLKAASIGTMGYFLKPMDINLLVQKIVSVLNAFGDHHPSRHHIRIKPLPTDQIKITFRHPNNNAISTAKLIDLSLGGIAFINEGNVFSMTIKPHMILQLHLRINQYSLQINCEVVNIIDKRCNVRFLNLSKEYQEIVSSYIYSRIGSF